MSNVFSWGETFKAAVSKLTHLMKGCAAIWLAHKAEMLFLSELFSDFYMGEELAILNTMSVLTLSLNNSILSSPKKDTGKNVSL